MIDFTDNWSAFYALRAVQMSCSNAIQPAPIPMSINIELTDADIDPDELDAHFLTSCVVAGGTTWDPMSNKEKRRAFWTDWIDNMFPLVFVNREMLLPLIR